MDASFTKTEIIADKHQLRTNEARSITSAGEEKFYPNEKGGSTADHLLQKSVLFSDA